MNSKSTFSIHVDPYRAGVEIGEALAEIEPEIVFLFSSIHYEGSTDLTEAIYDTLGSDSTVLIGVTGDGFYEKDKVGDAGVSALGINTHGSVKWHIAYESGLAEDPYNVTKRCMTKLNKATGGTDPMFYFLASDFRADCCEIVTALRATASGPVVGGFAGDDYALKRCFVYAQRNVLTDGIAIVAAQGEMAFDISISNDLLTVGRSGEITETDGTRVLSIDGMPAMGFLEREFGGPLEVLEEGITTFKLMGEEGGSSSIRSLLLPQDDDPDQSIRLMGGVDSGSRVQVCLASPEHLKKGVLDISKTLKELPLTPVAAIAISCAGRKQVMGGDVCHEVQHIVESCDSLDALAGIPSFGEFGSLINTGDDSSALFHNMTYVLLLLGDKVQ